MKLKLRQHANPQSQDSSMLGSVGPASYGIADGSIT
jgi:hypothetical protein